MTQPRDASPSASASASASAAAAAAAARANPNPNPVPVPPAAPAPQPGTPPPSATASRTRRGAWRTLAHGAPVFALTVVATAAVQALLVALEPDVALSPLGVLLAALSAASLLAASVVVWRTASRAATVGDDQAAADDRTPTRSARGGAGVGGLLVRCAVIGALALLAAIALPPLVPIVIALGCIPLAAGGLRASGPLIARHPLRLIGLTVVTAIVVALLELAALLLGFFPTGWPASAATWIAAGVAAAVLASHWQALAHRQTSAIGEEPARP